MVERGYVIVGKRGSANDVRYAAVLSKLEMGMSQRSTQLEDF